MFSLICAWINGWINNLDTGDLRRRRAHYDVAVMNTCTHDSSTVASLPVLQCRMSPDIGAAFIGTVAVACGAKTDWRTRVAADVVLVWSLWVLSPALGKNFTTRIIFRSVHPHDAERFSDLRSVCVLETEKSSLITSSSLAASEFVKITTSGTKSDRNSVNMTTFPFQWCVNYAWWLHQMETFSASLFLFIRPFEKRTYYAMAMSVRLSVRPSEFSGLFFNVLWDINLKLGICIQ